MSSKLQLDVTTVRGGAIWWTRTMAKGRHGVVCSFNCVIHVWAPWGRDACHLRRYINPRTFTFTFTLLLTFRLYTGLQCLRSDARYFGYSNQIVTCFLTCLCLSIVCLSACSHEEITNVKACLSNSLQHSAFFIFEFPWRLESINTIWFCYLQRHTFATLRPKHQIKSSQVAF